jgi:general secretion pathway protein I
VRAAPGCLQIGNPAPPTARGFTLVEVLVALAILGLAGLALVSFQTFQAAGTLRLTAATLARIEADNQAILALLAPNAPADGSGQSVNGGVPLSWRLTSGPSPDPDLFPNLVTIDIAIAAAEDAPPLAARRVVRPR